MFVVSILVMAAISFFSPAKTVYRPEHTHDVDIAPWRHAKLAGGLIIATTIVFYALLAQ